MTNAILGTLVVGLALYGAVASAIAIDKRDTAIELENQLDKLWKRFNQQKLFLEKARKELRKQMTDRKKIVR